MTRNAPVAYWFAGTDCSNPKAFAVRNAIPSLHNLFYFSAAMKFAGFFLWLLLCANLAFGQHIFRAKITDQSTWEPLAGTTATIKGQVRAISNEKGYMKITAIPEGDFEIEFNSLGYEPLTVTYHFPLPNPQFLHAIELIPTMQKLGEATVTTTRSSRTIADIPTRVEVIKGEELEQRNTMHPGDIRLVLIGNTGIQLQQTSVPSYNSSIRIHGLNGRYTQLLRDGFPLYSGFSEGLSVLQISPLDLRQVDVIKGSASTLYGGGAISGLVNLISRTPDDKRLNIMVNGTSSKGFDVSAFYGQRFEKIGATLLASRNSNRAFDPAGISLTAIPEFERYTFNPGLYFYFNDKTQLNVSLNSMFEDRIGGDTKYIRGEGDTNHVFFEKNVTDRVSSQCVLKHKLNKGSSITVKNSIGFFKRKTEMPDYRFAGTQFYTYSEAAWQHKTDKLEWILGINGWTDKFTEDKIDTVIPRDYSQYTLGAFAQNTWNVVKWLSLETGLRTDYQNDYGIFVLPRFSALFKISQKVTARLGGGMGYRTPTVFTSDAERIQYRDVLPMNVADVDAEKSIGGNFDVNYKVPLFDNQGSFSLNQLVFYTRINNPVELMHLPSGEYAYQLQDGFYDSKGTETNLRLKYRHLIWFFGYTFADTKQHFGSTALNYPLSARHRVNAMFMYEVKENFRLGFEAAFTGEQRLTDNSTSRSYWICNVMAEKMWQHVSIFVNCENVLNVRQTKYEKIYSGTLANPVFNDIYAPMDGVIGNVGIKIML